jgi:phospholipid/cholesterol/gamma-HCH transport system ATP-binding protein
MPAVPPIEIQAERLTKAFGDHVVLDGINLTVSTGEIVAIVGGSGSGKTVLLDHLTGLMQPDSGRVLAADHNERPDGAGQLPLVDLQQAGSDLLDRLRLHWSVVFQRNALFSGTVSENIALWLREHTALSEEQIEQRIRESVEAVRLDTKDVLDKQRDELSGGMAKRVAIARAIAADPIVVFYDEPTTGLDPMTAGAIHELVWEFHHRAVGPRPMGPRVSRTVLDRIVEKFPTGEDLLPDGMLRVSRPHSLPHGHPPAPRAEEDGRQTSGPPSAPQPPRTTVIVTHDKDLLRRLQPRVIMLDRGGVCFDGPYERFGKDGCEPARAYLETMPVLHGRRDHGK